MPLMIASHFLASSAGMMESNVVFLSSTFTPMSFAIPAAKSASEPTIFDPWKNSSGGYVASVQ